MQDQDPSKPIRLIPVPSRRNELGPEVFHRAVEILQAKHHVSESLAYMMLVEDAAHAGTTVRESAEALIAELLDTP